MSRHEAAHAIDSNTYDVLPRVRGEGWAQAITSRLNPLALRARFHRGFPGAVVTAEDLTKLFSKDPGGRRISEIYDESGAFFSYLAQRFGFEALVWMTGILDVGMATIRSERNYSAIANLPVALEELGKKVPDLRPEEFLTDFEGFMNAATS